MGLILELRRRNVFRMAALYLVSAWLVMQVAEVFMTLAGLSEWAGRALLVVLAVGFPISLILSWIYELTPEGIGLEKDIEPYESITHITGRRLDFVVIALLCAAVLVFAADKWWPRGPVERSVAVLPFVNLSDDPEQEYYSEGVAGDILNQLAKIPNLKVISRTSAFSFKGQNIDIPTIAARLNVAHILKGSIRRSGDRLRVTTQLIDAQSDTHLWSETYDRELDDIFAIHNEVAKAVADALEVVIVDDGIEVPETDLAAYELYLQALQIASNFGAECTRQSVKLLQEVLAIDRDYAPASTLMGRLYRAQASTFGMRDIHEGNELARHAIQQALAIDPRSSEALAALAEIEFVYTRDVDSATEHLRQAMALSLGDQPTLWIAAKLKLQMGEFEKSIRLSERLVDIDPAFPGAQTMLGWAYWWAGRLDDAQSSFRIATSQTGFGLIKCSLALVLLSKGDAQAALNYIDSFDGLQCSRAQALIYHALGDELASDRSLDTWVQDMGQSGAYQIAEIHAYRGDADLAFEWLEIADEQYDGGIANLYMDPHFLNLHDDPRWQPLVDEIGLWR